MKLQGKTSPTPQPRPLASRRDVATWLGVSLRTLGDYLLEGDFPQPIKGIGSPRWHWDTLESWAIGGGLAAAPRRKRGRPRARARGHQVTYLAGVHHVAALALQSARAALASGRAGR